MGSSDGTDREEYVFGRTVVNGTEYAATIRVQKPNGSTTSGIGAAEANGVAQVIEAGLEELEIPEPVEDKAESLAFSLRHTKTLQECKDEIAEEERARGGI